MNIRIATIADADKIVEIDKECFGKYGAIKRNVVKRLKKSPGCAVIGFENRNCIGFFIFEILEKDKLPENFSEFKLNNPIKGKWLHAVMFTPRDNYKNHEADSKLLLFAENIAKEKGCVESLVPLSKKHPFEENGVFEFWETNGYKKDGETKWIVNSDESVECYIYRKVLI